MTLGRKMLRSAKNRCSVVYNKPGRLVPSRPQGTKGLVLGLVVLVLSHWDTREMTITSFMNTFSNTGNIPTPHQPTVTVTTVTHTHWLPTVVDPHHLPGLVAFILAVFTYCKTLQGVKTVNARENVSLGIVHMYVPGIATLN